MIIFLVPSSCQYIWRQPTSTHTADNKRQFNTCTEGDSSKNTGTYIIVELFVVLLHSFNC